MWLTTVQCTCVFLQGGSSEGFIAVALLTAAPSDPQHGNTSCSLAQIVLNAQVCFCPGSEFVVCPGLICASALALSLYQPWPRACICPGPTPHLPRPQLCICLRPSLRQPWLQLCICPDPKFASALAQTVFTQTVYQKCTNCMHEVNPKLHILHPSKQYTLVLTMIAAAPEHLALAQLTKNG